MQSRIKTWMRSRLDRRASKSSFWYGTRSIPRSGITASLIFQSTRVKDSSSSSDKNQFSTTSGGPDPYIVPALCAEDARFGPFWWTQPDSNRRPSRCKRDALPAAPWAQIGTNSVLYLNQKAISLWLKLSYRPSVRSPMLKTIKKSLPKETLTNMNTCFYVANRPPIRAFWSDVR